MLLLYTYRADASAKTAVVVGRVDIVGTEVLIVCPISIVRIK